MSDERLKKMAAAMRRARVPVRRGPAPPPPQPTPEPVYGQVLDSWAPQHQPLPQLEKEPEIKRKEPELPSQQVTTPEDFEPETRTSLRMKRNKTRRMALSISVSEEEAELLRRHAASLDLGFSAWARQTLFRAMGRKPPARPKR